MSHHVALTSLGQLVISDHSGSVPRMIINLLSKPLLPINDYGKDESEGTTIVVASEAGRSVWLSTARHTGGHATASGLKWMDVGPQEPGVGTQLRNEALSEALKTRTEFTQAEWIAFDVGPLRSDAFVRAGDTYFQPDTTGQEERLQWMSRMEHVVTDIALSRIATSNTAVQELLSSRRNSSCSPTTLENSGDANGTRPRGTTADWRADPSRRGGRNITQYNVTTSLHDPCRNSV